MRKRMKTLGLNKDDQRARIHQLEEQNRVLSERIELVEEYAAHQRTRITELETQNKQLKHNYDAISNSKSWKITKPMRMALDLLKSGFNSSGIHRPISLISKQPIPVDTTVSVIIPTFNGEKELPGLLELLSNQINVREIEIIVVDSGSTDNTLTIAEGYGTKIIQITQAEFSHSHARNLGARNASGEYLLFMTQDAEPADKHWVQDMAQPILKDIAVAVSCREEPRDDCDLLGRFMIWSHSGYMGSSNMIAFSTCLKNKIVKPCAGTAN